MEKSWFEMNDVRRRKLDEMSWIPLRAEQVIEEVGKYAYSGYKEDYFGSVSLMLPQNTNTEQFPSDFGWSELSSTMPSHGADFEDSNYVPCEQFIDRHHNIQGIHPVLVQNFNSNEISQWQLHQDFIVALNLMREGDIWVSPNDGYVEVVRLKRTKDEIPCLLEVKAEYLKEYLCVRKFVLFNTSYRSRKFITEDASYITWKNLPLEDGNDSNKWSGNKCDVHEGDGVQFGEKTAVFHMGRENIDYQEDVPGISFADENIASHSYKLSSQGRKLEFIFAQLWRNQWLHPAKISCRIRGDKSKEAPYFITDAAGVRGKQNDLIYSGKWLWFSSRVVNALLEYRGSKLNWYTEQTGTIGGSPKNEVHFGINELGLINVFAKDIGLLPIWLQKIWAAYNVSPDGKVSMELLNSQVEALPADTQAPEPHLDIGFERLSKIFLEVFGMKLFIEHPDVSILITKAHRFRVTDKPALYDLAKDLSRLTADRFCISALQRIVPPPTGEKIGSLKSLQNVLASKLGDEKAYSMMSPFFGIYDLRLADAHLSSSKAEKALALIEINQSAPFVHQGYQLLHAFVDGIYRMIEELVLLDPKINKAYDSRLEV